MRFSLITGPVFSITCSGCLSHKQAGTELYRSASTGNMDGQPDRVYTDIEDTPYRAFYCDVYYCEACAARHAEAIDPTKSVEGFYSDTRGEFQV